MYRSNSFNTRLNLLRSLQKKPSVSTGKVYGLLMVSKLLPYSFSQNVIFNRCTPGLSNSLCLRNYLSRKNESLLCHTNKVNKTTARKVFKIPQKHSSIQLFSLLSNFRSEILFRVIDCQSQNDQMRREKKKKEKEPYAIH